MFAITGSEKWGDEGAPLFTARVDVRRQRCPGGTAFASRLDSLPTPNCGGSGDAALVSLVRGIGYENNPLANGCGLHRTD